MGLGGEASPVKWGRLHSYSGLPGVVTGEATGRMLSLAIESGSEVEAEPLFFRQLLVGYVLGGETFVQFVLGDHAVFSDAAGHPGVHDLEQVPCQTAVSIPLFVGQVAEVLEEAILDLGT